MLRPNAGYVIPVEMAGSEGEIPTGTEGQYLSSGVPVDHFLRTPMVPKGIGILTTFGVPRLGNIVCLSHSTIASSVPFACMCVWFVLPSAYNAKWESPAPM